MKTTNNKPMGNGHNPTELVMQTGLELLPLIMNNIPQAVFWKDRDLVYLGCNQAFADDAGFSSPEEIIGKTDFEMPWRDQAELYRADDQRVIDIGEPKLNYEEPQTTPNGSTIWLSTSKIPVHENGEVFAVLGMYEDITARKQTEDALREREETFRALTETSVDTIMRFDRQHRHLYVNPIVEKQTGIPARDFIGKTHEELGFPEYLVELWGEAIESVFVSGNPRRLEFELPNHSWVDWQVLPEFGTDGKVNYIVTFARDITERKQAEELVHQSETRFRSLFDTANDSIFLMQGPTIVDCNPRTAQIYGAERDQVIGQTPLTFSPEVQPDGQNSAEKAIAFINLALAGQPQVFYWKHKRLDGTLFDAEISLNRVDAGEEVYVQAFIRDITESRQAEQALRENQQLLQLVMDNIPQSVFWKDKNLTYLGVNQAFAKDAGFASPQEIVGRDDFDMPWKEQAELYRADDQRVLEGGEPKLNYEEPQTGPTGQVTWLRTSKVPMRDANGQVFAVLAFIRDITERMRLEREVQEALERRGYQVQVSTEISHEVAAASELTELFNRVVTQTKERLGYYHTQLLRYDPAQDAVILISGYGETGQKMLAGGHKMPMGEGLIGTAAATGNAVMRPTLADDPDWQPNPLLPETQGEIAVPIKFGDQILGVLDVQSNQAGSITEDDRLLLEGLCGQIAVAIEQTRLRQEMAERLEEVNRLYQSMSHEGWKTYRETANLPAGFMFDQSGLKPVEEVALANESFTNVPMKVLGGETVGSLAVANDPQRPISEDDLDFLQQVSDQVALALEGARLAAQTQSALAQTEKLSDAGLRIARSADLQELLNAVNETLGIPAVNRLLLGSVNYGSTNEMESMDIVANWWNGSGHEPSEIGRHYSKETLSALPVFMSKTPVFSSDTFHDERVYTTALELVKRQNIRSMAVLPLFLGSRQTGVLFLEAEEMHNFTQDEIRMFSAMAPQIATVLENRRQFERAQQQAERESTLNVISQKIQSATTVEAVLQIAARELGHALGAPMTIAQLSMKDKK